MSKEQNLSEIEPVVKKEDVYNKKSDLSGISGIFETFLRRFRIASYLIALTPIYILGICSMALAAVPGVWLFIFISNYSQNWPDFFRYFAWASGIITGYFAYGLTLIVVIPLINFIIPLRLKPFRGQYYSLNTVPWYVHNALTYIVRYTFLEFVTPTPINIWFYRRMGMKIGKDCHINTTNISDPALIEIEDKVTIGGSAHIIAHYASQGYVIVEPVKIRKGVTIGLKATIMGDVEIGEGAVIGPHEVVFPKSRIPAGRKPI